MSLTTAQLATLKAAVTADATAGPMRQAGDTYSLLAWCNGLTATLAWSIAVPSQTSDEAAVYTTYDTLTQGKRDSWVVFLRSARDFSKAKIRSWITDVWGASTAASISEGILQAGTEFQTNAQAVFGGTLKTTGTVSANQRTYTALISSAEVNQLLG